MKTEFVPRVNQLDAIQLENDIRRIIRDHLTTSLQNISPTLVRKILPEIDLCLRAALWNYSVRLNSATFGQQLLFICYDKDYLFSKHRLSLHFFISVLLKYIKDNITYRLTSQQRLQRAVSVCENLISFLDIVNYFRFLKVGKWPSLLDYALKLDNISMYGNRRREIGYSHMTRELIWGGFMELLAFSLPLINYHYIRRKLRNLTSFGSRSPLTTEEKKNVKLTTTTKCEYCKERPTLPHYMGCKHIFCYYCLMGNILADKNFECPSCGWNGNKVMVV